jgi:hypothetical protein
MREMKSKLHYEEPHNLSLLVKMLIPPLHNLLTNWTMNTALGTNADGCTLQPTCTGLRRDILRRVLSYEMQWNLWLPRVGLHVLTHRLSARWLHPHTHTHTHTHKHYWQNHKIFRQNYLILQWADSGLSIQKMLHIYQSLHKVLLFRAAF